MMMCINVIQWSNFFLLVHDLAQLNKKSFNLIFVKQFISFYSKHDKQKMQQDDHFIQTSPDPRSVDYRDCKCCVLRKKTKSCLIVVQKSLNNLSKITPFQFGFGVAFASLGLCGAAFSISPILAKIVKYISVIQSDHSTNFSDVHRLFTMSNFCDYARNLLPASAIFISSVGLVFKGTNMIHRSLFIESNQSFLI